MLKNLYTKFYNFFFPNRVNRAEIKEIQAENELLKEKLQAKQGHIDRTNTYYKRKLYELGVK